MPFHIVLLSLRSKASKSILGIWLVRAILSVSLRVEGGSDALSNLRTDVSHPVLQFSKQTGQLVGLGGLLVRVMILGVRRLPLACIRGLLGGALLVALRWSLLRWDGSE